MKYNIFKYFFFYFELTFSIGNKTRMDFPPRKRKTKKLIHGQSLHTSLTKRKKESSVKTKNNLFYNKET